MGGNTGITYEHNASTMPLIVSQNSSRVYGIERDITRDSFERQVNTEKVAQEASLAGSHKRTVLRREFLSHIIVVFYGTMGGEA